MKKMVMVMVMMMAVASMSDAATAKKKAPAKSEAAPAKSEAAPWSAKWDQDDRLVLVHSDDPHVRIYAVKGTPKWVSDNVVEAWFVNAYGPEDRKRFDTTAPGTAHVTSLYQFKCDDNSYRTVLSQAYDIEGNFLDGGPVNEPYKRIVPGTIVNSFSEVICTFKKGGK